MAILTLFWYNLCITDTNGGDFVKNSLIREKLRNLDSHYVHPSFALEIKLLKEIEQGYLEEAIATQKRIHEYAPPTLGKDPLRSYKNSMVALCTVLTRAAIAGGLIPEDAFNLSDVFINQIETFRVLKEIQGFEFEMIMSFTKLVQQVKMSNYAYPISKIVKYIYVNATSKLTVTSVAAFCSLSPDYISRLFKKEVGITMTEYIQLQKVEAAKHFLEFSKMSITEIATLLEFCNPAYFSNTFKKSTGVSPLEYRKTYGQLL